LVVRVAYYQLIVELIYKLGIDRIIRHYIIDHENLDILWEFHNGVVRGRYGGKSTSQKVV
jgi:hypothetical protein